MRTNVRPLNSIENILIDDRNFHRRAILCFWSIALFYCAHRRHDIHRGCWYLFGDCRCCYLLPISDYGLRLCRQSEMFKWTTKTNMYVRMCPCIFSFIHSYTQSSSIHIAGEPKKKQRQEITRMKCIKRENGKWNQATETNAQKHRLTRVHITNASIHFYCRFSSLVCVTKYESMKYVTHIIIYK